MKMDLRTFACWAAGVPVVVEWVQAGTIWPRSLLGRLLRRRVGGRYTSDGFLLRLLSYQRLLFPPLSRAVSENAFALQPVGPLRANRP